MVEVCEAHVVFASPCRSTRVGFSCGNTAANTHVGHLLGSPSWVAVAWGGVLVVVCGPLVLCSSDDGTAVNIHVGYPPGPLSLEMGLSLSPSAVLRVGGSVVWVSVVVRCAVECVCVVGIVVVVFLCSNLAMSRMLCSLFNLHTDPFVLVCCEVGLGGCDGACS